MARKRKPRTPARPRGSIQCCGKRGKTRCEREGTRWARINWYCEACVVKLDTTPKPNCKHISTVAAPGHAPVCAYCLGTLEKT